MEKYPEPTCFLIDKRRFYIKSIRSYQNTALQTEHQKATGQTILVWMDPTGWMGKKNTKKSDFLNIIPVTSNNLCGWKDMTRVWSHCHRKTAQRRWMKTGGKLVRAQLTSVNLRCTGPCFIPAVKNGPVLQFRGQRHVQWPFVDLENLWEQMCLFFILRCFSPEVQEAADPISPMIRAKLILLLFYFYCFIELLCSVAVQSRSIKPNWVARLCELSLRALQKHLRFSPTCVHLLSEVWSCARHIGVN